MAAAGSNGLGAWEGFGDAPTPPAYAKSSGPALVPDIADRTLAEAIAAGQGFTGLQEFAEALGAEEDTLLVDLIAIPDKDMVSAMDGLTVLGTPLARGKLIRQVRSLWTRLGADPLAMGAAPMAKAAPMPQFQVVTPFGPP